MARILILDDNQTRLWSFKRKFIGNNVDTCMTSSECIEKLSENEYDAVFLDHDLGGEIMVPSGPVTGFEVAEWLRDNPSRCPPEVFVHSYNPDGRKAIASILPEAKMAPGVWI